MSKKYTHSVAMYFPAHTHQPSNVGAPALGQSLWSGWLPWVIGGGAIVGMIVIAEAFRRGSRAITIGNLKREMIDDIEYRLVDAQEERNELVEAEIPLHELKKWDNELAEDLAAKLGRFGGQIAASHWKSTYLGNESGSNVDTKNLMMAILDDIGLDESLRKIAGKKEGDRMWRKIKSNLMEEIQKAHKDEKKHLAAAHARSGWGSLAAASIIASSR